MPYKVVKSGSGSKVVSPGHPQGFSKKPQSKAKAIKQMVAIMIHTGEAKSGRKIGVKKRGS